MLFLISSVKNGGFGDSVSNKWLCVEGWEFHG